MDKKESIELAEKWRTTPAAENMLLSFGIDPREPYVILKAYAMSILNIPGDKKIRVYDGAAMSEDGRFVARFPKRKVLRTNRDMYLDFRCASLEYRNMFDCQELWTDREYLTQSEIFTVGMLGICDALEFSVCIDEDGLMASVKSVKSVK